MSNSSSSGGDSRKESESRQSSEEIAQELFANIEQFTKQAKKAAESLESAVEASKTKVKLKSKNVGKDTFEDMDIVRKNVVDDFKTALKSLGDSNETEKEVSQLKSLPPTNEKPSVKDKTPLTTNSNNLPPANDSLDVKDSVQPPTTEFETLPANVGNQEEDEDCPSSGNSNSNQNRYEILNSIDMYTFASQTQDFFGGLLGKLNYYFFLFSERASVPRIFLLFP